MLKCECSFLSSMQINPNFCSKISSWQWGMCNIMGTRNCYSHIKSIENNNTPNLSRSGNETHWQLVRITYLDLILRNITWQTYLASYEPCRWPLSITKIKCRTFGIALHYVKYKPHPFVKSVQWRNRISCVTKTGRDTDIIYASAVRTKTHSPLDIWTGRIVRYTLTTWYYWIGCWSKESQRIRDHSGISMGELS